MQFENFRIDAKYNRVTNITTNLFAHNRRKLFPIENTSNRWKPRQACHDMTVPSGNNLALD